MRQPPSTASMRRPLCSGDREYGSGDRNFFTAASASPMLTPAKDAQPGIEASAMPSRSARASKVIQTTLVAGSSRQIVDPRIELMGYLLDSGDPKMLYS